MDGRREPELELLSQESRWKGDDDLVFAHPKTGKPIDRSRLLKRFKARCGAQMFAPFAFTT